METNEITYFFEVPYEVRFRIVRWLDWRDIERVGRTCKQAVSEMRHNGLWFIKVQELRLFRRSVDADDIITLSRLRSRQELFVDYVLGLRLDRLIVWLTFATSEMLTSFTQRDPNHPLPQPPSWWSESSKKPANDHNDDPMDVDDSEEAEPEPVPDDDDDDGVFDVDEDDDDNEVEIVEPDGDSEEALTDELKKVLLRRHYECIRDMESLEFDMASLDEKTGDIQSVLRTALINDEIPRHINVQSQSFSRLIARAFSNVLAPILQPDSKNCKPNPHDPTSIIMGMDIKKPHYAIRMPLRSILLDHACIWRSIVRLCWIDHMRERQVIIAYENLEMFYNKKMRHQMALEVIDGITSTNAEKEPYSVTTYPSMVRPPSTDQVRAFEQRSPGCSFYCSACGKLLGAGDSETFTAPHTSSLMPIYNQSARFCSTRCLCVALRVKDRNTVRCANPQCGAHINLAMALGSRCDLRDGTTPPQRQSLTDPWDLTSPVYKKFSVKMGSAQYKAFSEDIYSALLDTESIIDQSVTDWRRMINVYERYNIYSSMISQTQDITPKSCSIMDSHLLKVMMAQSQKQMDRLVFSYNLEGIDIWQRRIKRLNLLYLKLWSSFNSALGIDRNTDRRDPFMFAQDSAQPLGIAGAGAPPNIQLPLQPRSLTTSKPIVEFGQCLPFATLGIGLPVVREFMHIPFLANHESKYGMTNAWDRTDPRSSSADAMKIAAALKYDAFCSSSCMRGDHNDVRCLNTKCNAVLDTTAAIITLECMEVLFVVPEEAVGPGRQPTTTLMGYVCDEYCASAYMDAKAIELAKKRKAREQQQQYSKEVPPSKRRRPEATD